MPASSMITLGIGTPSSIPLLDLTGLFPSVSIPGQTPGTIPVGVEVVLIADKVYALPPRVINLTWQSTGIAALDVSLDQMNWTRIDTTAVAGFKTVTVSAVFIRATETVIVTCRKVKKKL